jgi:DNA-binding MarR family transcriptional regulator/N-acetylglutamate synthase-like GNAT family acetyltransferase
MEQAIAAIRRFNRAYTRRIGLLDEHLHHSGFGLTEARVLYELAQRDGMTASELIAETSIDAGYLSRILKALAAKKLITRKRSSEDGRQIAISLTKKGRAAFAPLNAAAVTSIGAMLKDLGEPATRRLVTAMSTIEAILVDAPDQPVTFRAHRPGDMGWIAHRHGIIYARDYGWDETFEALVAEIAAKFVKEFKPGRERCWIAERGNDILGSVFVVEEDATTAKLRLLYVEKEARGLGLGAKLVDEVIAFSRQAGYRRLVLWTNDILQAARHIYENRGFKLISEEKHRSFGHDLVGQYWELVL